MLSRNFQYVPSLYLLFFALPPPLPWLGCCPTPPCWLASAALLLGHAAGDPATLGVASRDEGGAAEAFLALSGKGSAALLFGHAAGDAATLRVASMDREGGTGIFLVSSGKGSGVSESFGHGLSASDKPS